MDLTVSRLPRSTAQRRALVTAVYSRFLVKRLAGPDRRGMMTAGYSVPWDLWTVTA